MALKDFDSIYREFQPRISRYLSKLAGEQEASDLTQSVFLKVANSLDSFRGEASLSTWIYRIATNTAYDYASSQLGRQKAMEDGLDEDGSLDDFADTTKQGTDGEYIRQEMNACIRGVVNELPENYRAVLILSEFEELTDAEISSILGVSVGTVKIRLHRARTSLRKAMECQCSLYQDERSELMCEPKEK